MVVNIKKWVDINKQVCLHKIGASALGKLTICIDNAGTLRGHCIVAIFLLCYTWYYYTFKRKQPWPSKTVGKLDFDKWMNGRIEIACIATHYGEFFGNFWPKSIWDEFQSLKKHYKETFQFKPRKTFQI